MSYKYSTSRTWPAVKYLFVLSVCCKGCTSAKCSNGYHPARGAYPKLLLGLVTINKIILLSHEGL